MINDLLFIFVGIITIIPIFSMLRALWINEKEIKELEALKKKQQIEFEISKQECISKLLDREWSQND